MVFFGVFFFGAVTFRGRVTSFLAVFALRVLLAAARLAFRAGAFAAVARLTIGLGRADLALNERLLADDFTEDCRDVDRLIPFATGLLM
jgi:hypothetical protein